MQKPRQEAVIPLCWKVPSRVRHWHEPLICFGTVHGRGGRDRLECLVGYLGQHSDPSGPSGPCHHGLFPSDLPETDCAGSDHLYHPYKALCRDLAPKTSHPSHDLVLGGNPHREGRVPCQTGDRKKMILPREVLHLLNRVEIYLHLLPKDHRGLGNLLLVTLHGQ
uniref:Uncharacterized protein n=1 Tax=Fusarium oxysporum (strain Fo5176) TaxID=660025 RepID=A0A0D2XA29_FUSOF